MRKTTLFILAVLSFHYLFSQGFVKNNFNELMTFVKLKVDSSTINKESVDYKNKIFVLVFNELDSIKMYSTLSSILDSWSLREVNATHIIYHNSVPIIVRFSSNINDNEINMLELDSTKKKDRRTLKKRLKIESSFSDADTAWTIHLNKGNMKIKEYWSHEQLPLNESILDIEYIKKYNSKKKR